MKVCAFYLFFQNGLGETLKVTATCVITGLLSQLPAWISDFQLLTIHVYSLTTWFAKCFGRKF